MLPQERDLVQKLAGRPFTLLGINSDRSRSALQKVIAEQHITWPQIYDRGTTGPIAKQWNVHAWPTIYVLDQQGIIRYRNVRGEALEKAVNTLLKGEHGPPARPAPTSKPAKEAPRTEPRP
jgi:peroxiredoxin